MPVCKQKKLYFLKKVNFINKFPWSRNILQEVEKSLTLYKLYIMTDITIIIFFVVSLIMFYKCVLNVS